jgi:hypothetical protein
MRLFFSLSALCVFLLVTTSCSEKKQGGVPPTDYTYPDVALDAEPSDTDEPDDTVVEDTYSMWTDPCVDCSWYFCPPLDAVWQKQICINNCDDPPTVVFEGECIEYLDCDPSQAIMEINLPCFTEDGYPGEQDKICNKGQIQYTVCMTDCFDEICDGLDNDCDGETDEDLLNACGECGDLADEICDGIDNDCDGETDEGYTDIEEICDGIDNNCNGIVDEGDPGVCENECGPGILLCIAGEEVCLGEDPNEEICDYLDNDCDGEVDEGQLNACEKCGLVPTEICNGLDDDCDGDTDEELIQPCGTACGEGFEVCSQGSWVSCNAPPVFQEICDGLDNDCDGQIDEELECICTIQDVGAFFPCQESPLLCGQGYKTCECLDPSCLTIVTTECYAICHWLAAPPGSDPNCDSLIGQELNQEDCNNFDDNCNQLIDEDLFQGCYTGPEGTLFVGICEPGQMTCSAGIWGHYNDVSNNFMPGFCKDEVTPQTEICNGIDDDCDGEVDWGKELQDTDILFIVDWSGSMDVEISAVMTALNQFAGNFSDETVLQWGVILGPKEVPGSFYDEQLVLYHNLSGFTDFLASMSGLGYMGMNTGSEMLLDALYLSLHNISGVLPYPLTDLSWSTWSGVSESEPPIQNFIVNWRPGADKVIIVFTDEYEQSYLVPQITPQNIKDMAAATPQLKIYTFSSLMGWAWEDISTTSGGKHYELTNSPTQMYMSLMEILDEICKSAP